MHNVGADDIKVYEQYKRKLIETLYQIDHGPWVLFDYPNNLFAKRGLVGIHAYGELSPVCKIIRGPKFANKECEKCHLLAVGLSDSARSATTTCWCWMKYIVCPVKVGKEERVFLIGERLDSAIDPKAAAELAVRCLEVSKEKEERIDEFKSLLEEAYASVQPFNEETVALSTRIVEDYKSKIENAHLKVDFEELESHAKGFIDDFQIMKYIQELTNTSKRNLEEVTDPLIKENIKKEPSYWKPVIGSALKICENFKGLLTLSLGSSVFVFEEYKLLNETSSPETGFRISTLENLLKSILFSLAAYFILALSRVVIKAIEMLENRLEQLLSSLLSDNKRR